MVAKRSYRKKASKRSKKGSKRSYRKKASKRKSTGRGTRSKYTKSGKLRLKSHRKGKRRQERENVLQEVVVLNQQKSIDLVNLLLIQQIIAVVK